MFLGPAIPDLLGECGGVRTTIRIAIRASEVVFQFAHALIHRLLRVRTGRRHIAELNELFEGLRGGDGIEPSFRRMYSSVAGNVVPTFDGFDLWWFFKRVEQHLTIHVATGRQSEQREQCRAYIKQTSAKKFLTCTNTRTFDAENPEVPMFHRRTRWLKRDVGWAQMIGMKPMIAHQDDGRVLIG